MKASVKTTYDSMEQVFNALDTFINGTEWISCVASVTLDGAGRTHSMNCGDAQHDGFTFTERVGGTRVVLTPAYAQCGPGQTAQFTAAAQDADGNPVASPTYVWSLAAGSLGSIDASGLYTAPSSITAAVNATVVCSLVGAQAWSSGTVGLAP